MAEKKKSSKVLLIILIVLLIGGTIGGGIYWWISGEDKRTLTKMGYLPDDITTIIENELADTVIEKGDSPMLIYALHQDQENIKDYEYFLLTNEQLNNIKVEQLYSQIVSLKEKGYTAQQVQELIKRLTLSKLAYVSVKPHTENFDVLINAIDHDYSIEDSYDLSLGDPEFANMIITGEFTLEYTKPLTDLGYSTTDAKVFLTTFDLETVDFIKTMKYIPELGELVTTKDFNLDLLPRYLLAIRTRGKGVGESVGWVNNNEDYIPASELNWGSFYHDTIAVEDQASLTALVNKQYYLSSDYYPNDLVDLPSMYDGTNNMDMRAPAAEAFYKLSDASVEAGYDRIRAQSNFRSYALQESLYNRYVTQYGSTEVADRESARPGYSEHQTGLVSDVTGPQGMLNFDKYAGYQWTLEHLHEFGFIQRYPENKEYITGYMFESWHMRFVGIEPATIMYQHGWTLEEYKLLFD